MLIEDFTTKVAERMQGDGPSRILDFIGILELIMTLMSSCAKNREDFVGMTSNPTRVQKAILNMHVRRTMGIRGRRHIREMSAALMDEAGDMSDDALGAAYDEGMKEIYPNEIVFDSL